MEPKDHFHAAFLPTPPEKEIFRDSYIRQIGGMFGNEKTSILIHGPESSGKTILLSQFTRYFEGRCISFFVQNNVWQSSLSFFLLELCIQMQQLPALALKFTRDLSSQNYEEHLIKQLFYRMYRELLSYVKTTNDKPFYFVIDGLDKIQHKHGEDSILNHLPVSDPSGVYLLFSSTEKENNSIKADLLPIQYFSIYETKDYFGQSLKESQIDRIYKASEGMPGYIYDIKKSLNQIDLNRQEEYLANLPTTYNKLIENSWEKVDTSNEQLICVLAILAISSEPMNFEILEKITNINKGIIKKLLENITFTEVSQDNNIVINNAYKTFITNKLHSELYNATQLLINYYEDKEPESSSLFLPDLYIKNNDYEALVKLINVENLTKILGIQRNVSIVRKNIRSLSEMAYKKNDYQRLLWGALTESFFTQLISTPPAIENQINALLAQDNFEQAIQSAYSCFLPEDRLMLFAKIGNEMIKKEQPIPSEVIKTIEESVELLDNSVELTESLTNKLLSICTHLITVQTNVALKLIEKIAESKGTSDHKNKLMDILLTNVLLKVAPEDSAAEKIKSQINNDSLNDFATVASSVLSKVSLSDLYKQVEQISDISAKIYLLQSWCNMNSSDESICEVITYALNLMKLSSDYSPTQLQLRKLAQCLIPYIKTHGIEEVKKLTEEIDKLKETIIKNPLDEYARLELILAFIIKNWSPQEATERYYEVYFSTDKIVDMDIKCFVIVRLLLSLKDLAPNDKKLEQEFVNELNLFFENLLNTSADHLEITRKLITAITKYNPSLAVEFATKLNRAKRRDYAYAEILREYTKNPSKHDMEFIYNTLDLMLNKSHRDWVLIRILERYKKSGSETPYIEKLKYLDRILSINSPIGKTYAITFFIQWIYHDDVRKAGNLFENLKKSFYQIDCLWKQVSTGFDISSSLAETNKDFSAELFQMAEKQKQNSIFSDERIAELYIETCKIIIRIVPDILNGKGYKEKVSYCIKAIGQIPSVLERNLLYSSLGLKCYASNKIDCFEEISRIVLKEIEMCTDELSVETLIIYSAPLLYEIERNLLFDKISILANYMKDIALDELLKYLFSKRIPIDPIDITNYPVRLDFPDSLKVVEVMKHLETDAIIYNYIDKLVDSITYRKDNKLKTSLNERQILTIAEEINNIINTKLPDINNITHDGYKIACRITLTKLKESLKNSNSFRANNRWDPMNLSWEEIKREIQKVPNTADVIFLQASASADSFFSDKSFSETTIFVAERGLNAITNSIDRADRFHMVAKTYHQISNSKAAKFLLEEAVKQSNVFYSQESRDQLLGGAVELAHSIDPNFASSLATAIDSPMFLAKTQEQILALNLRNDPSKLDLSRRDDYLPVITSACTKILNSLYSGKGITQHDSVIAKWMYCCLGYEFETVSNIAVWFVENSIMSRSKSLHISKLDSLYSESLQLLDMISKMGNVMNVTATKNNEYSSFMDIVAPKMQTFSLGEKKEAFDFLKNWLRENAEEYVKIYDPYFNKQDLEILKFVSQSINVKVLLSIKHKDLDVTRIQEDYMDEWKIICDQVPPETVFYLFATPSGKTPQHDRFIVTEKAGLSLGTSLNGLGSKDTVINILNQDEKKKIENEIIDILIVSPPRFIGEEKLITRTFWLE